MLKRFYFCIGLVGALMLCSCEKAYKKIIPADSLLVCEIQTGQIAQKADLNNQKNNVLQVLEQLIEDKELLDHINSFISDPQQYGLDFVNPTYFFMPSDIENLNFFIVIPVSDFKKVKQFISDNSNADIQEEDDILYSIEEDFIFAASKEAFVIGSSNNKNDYLALLKHNNEPFFASDAGKFMENNAADITLLANAEALPKNTKNIINNYLESHSEIDIDNIEGLEESIDALLESQVLLNLQFESGKIALNMVVNSPTDLTQANNAIKNIDTEAIGHVPTRNLLGFIAFGIDGKNNIELLEKTLQSISNDIDEDVKYIIDSLVEFIGKLDGTLLFAFNGRDYDAPEIVAVLPTAQKNVYNMLASINEELPSKISMDGDSKYTAIYTSEQYDFNRSNTPITTIPSSDYLYAYLDLQTMTDLAYKETLRTTSRDEFDYTNKTFDILRLAQFAELHASDAKKTTIDIILNNSSKNSLAIVLDKSIVALQAYAEYEK